MAEWCNKCGVEIWSWCLMPNHVHLIAVPSSENALARAIDEAHRRYTCRINVREGWRGHLWQERFSSFPMDETCLFAAARYVEMNPVAAGLVQSPADDPWSSARSRLTEATDPLVTISTLVDMVGDWREFLVTVDEETVKSFQRHERSGRPLGGSGFVEQMEAGLERLLRPQKRGPKPKSG